MKRREFIALVGGGAAWPFGVCAQQITKLPTIGFMSAATAPLWASLTAAFEERLHELGWTKDRTVVIEYRWADGQSTRFSEIAAEFVRLNVDAIVTGVQKQSSRPSRRRR
jgi:putative tryptophan/tyrosine transport system substrate-binding protein